MYERFDTMFFIKFQKAQEQLTTCLIIYTKEKPYFWTKWAFILRTVQLRKGREDDINNIMSKIIHKNIGWR